MIGQWRPSLERFPIFFPRPLPLLRNDLSRLPTPSGSLSGRFELDADDGLKVFGLFRQSLSRSIQPRKKHWLSRLGQTERALRYLL